jgi:hypothetical protein
VALAARGVEEHHRHEHDREEDDVIETALEPQRPACGARHIPAAQQAAHHDGIGGRERRSENHGGCGRDAEQGPRGSGDERRGDHRARTQNEKGQSPVPPNRGDFDGDGVGEQHEHQRERSNRLQDWRTEIEGEQPEAIRAKHEAQEQKDRNLGKAPPIHHARQQRRHHHDHAHEGEGGRERGGGVWRQGSRRRLV